VSGEAYARVHMLAEDLCMQPGEVLDLLVRRTSEYVLARSEVERLDQGDRDALAAWRRAAPAA